MEIISFASAVAGLGILGIIFGTGLAYASVKFAVEEDPKKIEIDEALPGANCGACGFAGCSSYAEAVAKGEEGIDSCPVGGEELIEKIADIMGVAASSSDEKKTAKVLCQGGNQETFNKAEYQGVPSCQAASMVDNFKSCQYGCLGFGDCAAVCDFDAIVMNDNGLPEIDPDKCAECGVCVTECPRSLIEIVSSNEDVITNCKSALKGKEVKVVCEKGCFGCTICAKKCPVDAIEMEDNLPVVDTEGCIGCGVCVKNCPTDAFVEVDF
ncbi:RnfABCDGE type electron transport complex subunit B [Natroniella sulfidigena]|uniref:RnfABCDGE type electron transport complex subunit B n=1 Tax=Natroniella sulfidigena TaxID=723921 RepID=UPI00200B01EE|nr:RnfABCDGE type electron transport complex subunit B [Natroniella sulfidigena]MCK8815858.1 RnfABCDGE type electron transport complex subunit B [Natroniella sulfidigena]